MPPTDVGPIPESSAHSAGQQEEGLPQRATWTSPPGERRGTAAAERLPPPPRPPREASRETSRPGERVVRWLRYNMVPTTNACTVKLSPVEGRRSMKTQSATSAASEELKPQEEPKPQIGRYSIERLLARGGMAEVFVGRASGPAGFSKRVVIKRILPDLAQDETFVSMFLNEARLAALLE